jgi:tetratricopeptide (TPR) repeat protein
LAWQGVAERPDEAAPWHGLALALIDVGKLDTAAEALRRAVALDPFGVMARNNLGIVLQRLGDGEAAREAYRTALMLDPENAVAHGNLAGLLCELGQFEAAADHAGRAITLDPSPLGPHVYAAIALSNLGQTDAALASIDRALSLAPRNGRVVLERADLLRVLGRRDEALDAARTAVELEPENPKAHNLVGLILQATGDDQAALDAFDRAEALTIHPGQSASVRTNRAIVLAELGEREAALRSLDQALAADPALAAAWMVRAELKPYSPGDADIAAMEALLARSPLPARDRILLSFALGKAYLDLKDGPNAFRHLGEGGRLQRAALAYDAEAALGDMAAIASAFSSELFDRLGGAGHPSEAPIFIVGMPRSGGTLIEQILASQRDARAGGEATHVETLARSLGQAFPNAVANLAPAAIRDLGQRYLTLAGPGASRLTDKAANSYLYVGLIHLILPGARIIHCRRDPIDTCLSCYSKLFATGQAFSYDLADLGAYYRGYAALADHWRSVLPTDRFIEVDYEAVVDDLEGQTRRLLGFCGLDWDEACLRFHETRRPVRTASLNQVRQPLYRGSVGRWRPFRDQLGPLLAALGVEAGETAP